MPWGRVDDTYYDHPKLDELGDVHEWPDRLAAAGLNTLAWSWCNRFLTDGRVPKATVAKLGGTIALADLLVSVGLWESHPGGYQIHDFLVYNDSREQVMERREREAQRKATYRAGRRPAGTPSGTSSVAEADVPPSVPVGHDEARVPMSQRDSRARMRGANPDPTRPDPTRPTESLTRGSARTRAPRADVAALHARGWKRVTKAQRAILDEVLGRHDQTGPAFAAEVIRSTPPDRDPLEEVMKADRLWQDARRRAAEAEEQGWNQTKAKERDEATGRIAWLEEAGAQR